MRIPSDAWRGLGGARGAWRDPVRGSDGSGGIPHAPDARAQGLGRPASDPPYLLVADIDISDSGLAITEDSSITRYVVRGRSRYAMTGPEGFRPVSGFVESVSAYSATGSLYATRAARRDAEERIAEDMADRIATRISAELDKRAQDK